MRSMMLGMCLMLATGVCVAEQQESCSIAAGRWEGKMSFSWGKGDCSGERHCHEGNSDNMSWSRWSGITPEDLQHEGVAIDARMKGDAGEMRCVGKVHESALRGVYSFTPDEHFVKQMEAMGFSGLDDQLQGYVMLDVSLAWVKSMQDAHVEGMTAQNLMGLRALKVDPEYVRGMSAAGYPELHAEKLTSMKAVGVSPEKVKAVHAMGFTPTQDELIQMAVFKIDAPFVERMRARGLKDLTISKLVQIKIFKLDE